MNAFNIKVTEYGITKGEEVLPSHYTWIYCTQKKIPYITIKPKINYTNIEFDVVTIDSGLAFEKGYSLISNWSTIYKNYANRTPLPKARMLLIGAEGRGLFTVLKKDQDRMVTLLMREIERYVNEYGIIDIERHRYFNETKNQL